MNIAVVSLTSHFSTTQCLRLKHALEAKGWFGVDFLDSLFGLWLLPWFRQILIRHCEISPGIQRATGTLSRIIQASVLDSRIMILR